MVVTRVHQVSKDPAIERDKIFFTNGCQEEVQG